jgi:Na+-transporting NADH:ubiquinone oxidoreductase subunit NqrB
MQKLRRGNFGEKVGGVFAFLNNDPRHYQIGVLSALIFVGISSFGFSLPLWHAVSCIGAALTTQFIGDKALGRKFDPRSPMISALSLTLLLRTGSIWLSIAAGVLAIGSKYLIRYNGKHIFNPANFGLVVLALLFTGAWVSPGQWGTVSWLALMIAGLGGIVTGKAKRWDVSLGFLGFFALLAFARALWLGDPLSIPVHQLQSGALLIFTFFMISDPKTTPNARAGRVAYSALVASVGFVLSAFFYQSAGPIYALILCAPLVPLFDHFFKARLYQWPTLPQPLPSEKGSTHEQTIKIPT